MRKNKTIILLIDFHGHPTLGSEWSEVVGI